MHTLMWGKASVDDTYTRPILLDDELVCDIDMERYLEAIVGDSMTGYSNIIKTEEILSEAIRIVSSRLERKINCRELKKSLDSGWIS